MSCGHVIITLVVVYRETQNVHESEKGGNEGFTYMTVKTWSGSAEIRDLETHRFKRETKRNQQGV